MSFQEGVERGRYTEGKITRWMELTYCLTIQAGLAKWTDRQGVCFWHRWKCVCQVSYNKHAVLPAAVFSQACAPIKQLKPQLIHVNCAQRLVNLFSQSCDPGNPARQHSQVVDHPSTYIAVKQYSLVQDPPQSSSTLMRSLPPSCKYLEYFRLGVSPVS